MHGLIAATDSLEKVAQNNMLTARHAQTAIRSLGQLRARLEYADLTICSTTSTRCQPCRMSWRR